VDDNQVKGGWIVDIGQYVTWLVTSLIAVVDALYVREAVLAGLSLFQAAQTENYHRQGGVGLDFSTGFAISVIDDFMLLILGCAAVAAVITIEYYFRRGRPKGLLLKRIGIVVGIELAIIVVSILIRVVIYG
jgi:hypothetical protein